MTLLSVDGAIAGPVRLEDAVAEPPADAQPASPEAARAARQADEQASSVRAGRRAMLAASAARAPLSDEQLAELARTERVVPPSPAGHAAEAASARRRDEMSTSIEPGSAAGEWSSRPADPSDPRKPDEPGRADIGWTGGGALQGAGPGIGGTSSGAGDAPGWSDEHRAAARNVVRDAIKFFQEVIGQPVFWVVVVLVVVGGALTSLLQRKGK